MSDPVIKIEEMQDAREEKHMEKAAIEGRNMAQKYLDVAGVIFVVIGADQRIRVINRKGCAVLNCEGEDIIGLNWFDTFIPARIRGKLKEVFKKLCKGELSPVEYYENPILARNGEERLIAWHNTVLTDEHGKIYATLSSGEDITDRKKAEEEIRSLSKFPSENPNPVLRIAQDGTLLYINAACSSRLPEWNLKSGQLAPTVMREGVLQLIENGKIKELLLDYCDRVYSFLIAPVVDAGYANLYGFDVTERKKAEDKLKNTNQELEATQKASLNIMEDLELERRRLDASLKERNVLLRELHHRVKNNMQIMSSLLRLQARTITDSHYSWMFKDAYNRVAAMSLIHEKLYGSKDMVGIDFRDYIRSLAKDLFQTYGITETMISLKTDVEASDIGIDRAIPLGLIINELITNSIKYAFPGDRTGEISISLHEVSDNEVELFVSDNGIGIPRELDVRNTKTLGMQLVTTLAEDQLKGSIAINMDKGTEFRIRFKI